MHTLLPQIASRIAPQFAFALLLPFSCRCRNRTPYRYLLFSITVIIAQPLAAVGILDGSWLLAVLVTGIQSRLTGLFLVLLHLHRRIRAGRIERAEVGLLFRVWSLMQPLQSAYSHPRFTFELMCRKLLNVALTACLRTRITACWLFCTSLYYSIIFSIHCPHCSLFLSIIANGGHQDLIAALWSPLASLAAALEEQMYHTSDILVVC